MKFSKKKIWDLVFLVVILVLLVPRIPGIWQRFQKEGKAATPSLVQGIGGEERLPRQGQKQIVIFWATWCKPCDIELDRFKAAVGKGELAADQIAAVSFGEEKDLVMKAAQDRAYPFPVYADPPGILAEAFSVDSTPTVAHIDAEGRIVHLSAGLGILTIYRAKWFLN